MDIKRKSHLSNLKLGVMLLRSQVEKNAKQIEDEGLDATVLRRTLSSIDTQIEIIRVALLEGNDE